MIETESLTGETGHAPAPKEQPPRKLSGKRTAAYQPLESGERFAHPPTG